MSDTFHFRLKPLLTLREAARRERQIELAAALAVERELAALLARRRQELNHERQRIAARLAPGQIDAASLAQASRYEQLLIAEIETLADRHRHASAEVDRRREALAEADREVRVLEKLREQRQTQHLRATMAQEVKCLDEVAARMIGGDS
jgi:flagellar FliJ protein